MEGYGSKVFNQPLSFELVNPNPIDLQAPILKSIIVKDKSISLPPNTLVSKLDHLWDTLTIDYDFTEATGIQDFYLVFGHSSGNATVGLSSNQALGVHLAKDIQQMNLNPTGTITWDLKKIFEDASNGLGGMPVFKTGIYTLKSVSSYDSHKPGNYVTYYDKDDDLSSWKGQQAAFHKNASFYFDNISFEVKSDLTPPILETLVLF